MRTSLRFVGLDVHKDSIAVAVAESGRGPAQLLETIAADELLLLQTVEQASARVRRLTLDMGELVERWTLGPLVRALQALRGVDLVTAVVLAAEIGNFKRFRTPKQLMAYLGLVPSEHSSGGARRQGGITRTGNRHARWVLVEAAWNYRFRPSASRTIQARRQHVAAGVRAIAERAEQRLSRRFRLDDSSIGARAARKP